MKNYSAISSCRGCKSSRISNLFTLGDQYVIDFPPPGCEHDGVRSPLQVVMCNNCNLVQLRHTADQDSIYSKYWYKSGINGMMRKHLKNVVDKAMAIQPLNSGDKIIDIGSNDGTLASFYPEYTNKIGFEPSYNVWKESADKVKWSHSYNDYFSHKESDAKIITSCAMFYDLDNPHQFVDDIRCSLSSDGLWVDQQNYLVSMLKNYSYDNISHEHLCYYSLMTFNNIIKEHDLEIVDVEINDVNGGSFRTYIRRSGRNNPVPGGKERIEAVLAEEAAFNLDTPIPYEQFWGHVELVADKLFEFVFHEKMEKNSSFYLYGASTRGQTIVQFSGLDNTLISAASERNADKYMKVTMGSGIPIVSEEIARLARPDYMIVLPYSFREDFLEREQKYLDQGGAFIFPLPEVEIVTKNTIRTL